MGQAFFKCCTKYSASISDVEPIGAVPATYHEVTQADQAVEGSHEIPVASGEIPWLVNEEIISLQAPARVLPQGKSFPDSTLLIKLKETLANMGSAMQEAVNISIVSVESDAVSGEMSNKIGDPRHKYSEYLNELRQSYSGNLPRKLIETWPQACLIEYELEGEEDFIEQLIATDLNREDVISNWVKHAKRNKKRHLEFLLFITSMAEKEDYPFLGVLKYFERFIANCPDLKADFVAGVRGLFEVVNLSSVNELDFLVLIYNQIVHHFFPDAEGSTLSIALLNEFNYSELCAYAFDSLLGQLFFTYPGLLKSEQSLCKAIASEIYDFFDQYFSSPYSSKDFLRANSLQCALINLYLTGRIKDANLILEEIVPSIERFFESYSMCFGNDAFAEISMDRLIEMIKCLRSYQEENEQEHTFRL